MPPRMQRSRGVDSMNRPCLWSRGLMRSHHRPSPRPARAVRKRIPSNGNRLLAVIEMTRSNTARPASRGSSWDTPVPDPLPRWEDVRPAAPSVGRPAQHPFRRQPNLVGTIPISMATAAASQNAATEIPSAASSGSENGNEAAVGLRTMRLHPLSGAKFGLARGGKLPSATRRTEVLPPAAPVVAAGALRCRRASDQDREERPVYVPPITPKTMPR